MIILFLLYMTVLGLLCFLHGDSLPNITGTWFGFRADNVAHAAMFLPFVPLAFLSISIRKTNILKDMLLLIFVTVAGACPAYATELIQGQLKYRSYEQGVEALASLKDFGYKSRHTKKIQKQLGKMMSLEESKRNDKIAQSNRLMDKYGEDKWFKYFIKSYNKNLIKWNKYHRGE